ncbi:unnamed protein product, partial [Aphanomyces euteiches]
ACKRGDLDVVKELLGHGASINRTTNEGQTTIHFASSYGHLELVRELLAQGVAIEAKTEIATHHCSKLPTMGI